MPVWSQVLVLWQEPVLSVVHDLHLVRVDAALQHKLDHLTAVANQTGVSVGNVDAWRRVVAPCHTTLSSTWSCRILCDRCRGCVKVGAVIGHWPPPARRVGGASHLLSPYLSWTFKAMRCQPQGLLYSLPPRVNMRNVSSMCVKFVVELGVEDLVSPGIFESSCSLWGSNRRFSSPLLCCRIRSQLSGWFGHLSVLWTWRWESGVL